MAGGGGGAGVSARGSTLVFVLCGEGGSGKITSSRLARMAS